MIDKNEKFVLQSPISILEGSLDEGKMTVEACVLSPCISGNNRYYSPSIVEKASTQLLGLKSYADHDNRSVKNTVAKIVSSRYEDGRAIATFKFSKARDVAESIFTRIKEGIITDVSIAASGVTKRVKINNEWINEITDIKLHSVDFVSEGGVPDAKVLQVFESNALPVVEEAKEEVEVKMAESKLTLEELKLQNAEIVAAIEKPFQEELETIKKANEELSAKLKSIELAELKNKIVSELQEKDEIKALVMEKLIGSTEEELRESCKKAMAEIQRIKEATAVVSGVPEVKIGSKQYKTTKDILEDSSLTNAEKGSIMSRFWWGK